MYSGYGLGGLPIISGKKFGIDISLIGDIDGDNKNDIVVGNFWDHGNGTSSGAAWILRLDTTGKVLYYNKIQAGISNFSAPISSNDYFGVSVAGIGDFDHDGINDIAVGAFEDDEGGTNNGAVYIIKLQSNGGVKGYYKLSNSITGALLNQVPSNSNMGVNVTSIQDIDGNGVKDLLVGNYDTPTTTTGSSLICLLDTNGLAINKISINSTNFSQITAGERFAFSVSPYLDVDNNGHPEIIIGAPNKADGGPSKGAFYMLTITSTFHVATSKTNATCSYSTNGTAKVTPSNGVAPYTYLWSNNVTTDSIGNLPHGTYSVTVTDALNRQVVKNINIYSNPAINLSYSSTMNLCAGSSSSIFANASGGSGSGFAYHWNNGLLNASTHTISPSTNTTYTVYVSDNAGCRSDTVAIIVNVNPVPIVTASGLNVAYCSNDHSANTLIGTPIGGSFIGSGVSGNSFVAANSTLGSHQIIYSYTSAQGCVGRDTLTTTIYAAPNIQFSGIASAYCQNSPSFSLSATPTGGTFTVDNNASAVLSPASLNLGNHKIKYFVTNSFGCSATDSLNIFVNPVTSASISGLLPSYCDNEPAATVIGIPSGGTFLAATGLSGSSFNPSIAAAGNHNIFYRYTNIYGCTDTAVQTTTVFASTPVSISTAQSLYCNNGGPVPININVIGGTLSGSGINNSTHTFNPSIAGVGQTTIGFTYTNSLGCTTTTTHNVMVNAPVTASFTGLNLSYCSNDLPSILVGSPAGGVFVGPNLFGGNIFNPSLGTSGMKTIQYIYFNGCTDTATQYSVIYPKPLVNITLANNFYCYTVNPVTLTANPTGGTFTGNGVSGTTFSPSVASTGYHAVIYSYTNSMACTNSDTLIIQVGNNVNIDFSSVPNSYCINGNANALAVNPTGGTWTGDGISANLFNSAVAGLGNHWLKYDYSVSATCAASDSLQVSVFPNPSPSISGTAISYCHNNLPDTLIGSPSGGQLVGTGLFGNLFYPNLAALGTNLIQYLYTDSNNCSASASVSVQVNDIPDAEAGMDTLLPCFSPGVSLGTTAQAGISYLWSPAAGLSNSMIANPLAKPTATTNYVITSTDLLTNCHNTDTVVISIPPNPTISLSNHQQICLKDTATLSVSGASTFNWSTGANGDTIHVSPSSSTYYWVIGTDSLGCSSFDTVLVTVNPLPNPQLTDSINFTGLDSLALFPGNFANYLWNTGYTSSSLMVYVGDVYHTFSVMVTDHNGCSETDSVYLYFAGIHDLFSEINIKLYPNPAKDFVQLEFSKIIELPYWTLTDINGKTVKYQTINLGIQTLNIDVMDLSAGQYFLTLGKGNKAVHFKIIVSR